MKPIYITSIENFSGKTAVLLALGRRLQVEGHKVGYFKPVSYEALETGGRLLDEDVSFVRNVLGLKIDPSTMAGVVVTSDTLPRCLNEDVQCEFPEQITTAFEACKEDSDVMLLEGGGSLRQGHVLGISTPFVAQMLDSQVLGVIKYRGPLRLLDDIMTAKVRLEERLMGVIINRVSDRDIDFINEQAIPYLESQDIPVFGIIPERPSVAAISIQELVDVLNAEVLTGWGLMDKLVETITVGAMGAAEAISRFRRFQNKAVVTGGDRTDVQLAALDTSTRVLILTGNLTPNPAVLQRATDQGVPVLMTAGTTMDTIESIETVFGKTRLGQPEKLAHFESLMAENVDYKRLFETLGL